RSGTLTRTLLQTPGTAQILSIAVHPDGQRIAIGFSNYIQLRDLRTNRPLHNLAANASVSQLLNFSPDGRHFVNTDWLGDRLRVWRL
ncbi:MAG: WD40 repeat domain-containing protein, partial [Leptolyngbyaceae cyanobacterium SM1_3_5]|nr:WD40 repeat domain-containing protein [Leptolyngbyaceae cyanobacterium SM1_3_5]